MNNNESIVGNCPHCTKVIFKNGLFASDSSFMMRCPSCKRLLEIEIKTKIEIIIKPAERYLSKNNQKFGELSAFLAFLGQPISYHYLFCIFCTTKCICLSCILF